VRHGREQRERQGQDGDVPEGRGDYGSLRNAALDPTVAKGAGLQGVPACAPAEEGGDTAPKSLVERPPGDLELWLGFAAEWLGRLLVRWRCGRRGLSQKIDGVLDTLKFHVSGDYTVLGMEWKRGVAAEERMICH
jgi:hypothetical protein